MIGYRISRATQADILEILTWTQTQFGDLARRRYEHLIATALRDVAAQPNRSGSVERHELGHGVRSWHLCLSRERARTEGGIVHQPRHFLIYRSEPKRIAVGRVLHDVMELEQHLESKFVWQ